MHHRGNPISPSLSAINRAFLKRYLRYNNGNIYFLDFYINLALCEIKRNGQLPEEIMGDRFNCMNMQLA